MQFLKIITNLILIIVFAQSLYGQTTTTEVSIKENLSKTLLACGDHFQLTDEVSMYNDVVVHGDYVAWGDIFGNIRLYKISTDEITPIITGGVDDFNSWVFLDDDYLYFNTDTGGFRKYHLESQATTALYGNTFNGAFIAGNNMASIESVGGVNLEVFYKDLNSTGDAVNISNNPDSDNFLFVSTNAIAWVTRSSTEEKLMLYEPAQGTNQGSAIVSVANTSNIDIHRPIIHDNQLYFSKRNGSFYQLWSYDIQAGGAPVLLVDFQSNHYVNTAYDDYLVIRNSDQIKLYEISTGIMTDIPNSNNNSAIRINKESVMWEYESASIDIFQYDIAQNQTSTFANSAATDFFIQLSDEYAVYAKGDMVNDHLFISNRIDLSIQNPVIEHQSAGTNNGSINVSVVGGVGGNTYTWTGPNGFQGDMEDISGLLAGEYTLDVVDGNACMTSYTGTVDVLSSTQDIDPTIGLNIYPNPVGDRLRIELEDQLEGIDNIEIVDVHGRLVATNALEKIRDKQWSIACADWASGVYFVKLRLKDKLVQKQFVKH